MTKEIMVLSFGQLSHNSTAASESQQDIMDWER